MAFVNNSYLQPTATDLDNVKQITGCVNELLTPSAESNKTYGPAWAERPFSLAKQLGHR